jgi:hypothetical protein
MSRVLLYQECIHESARWLHLVQLSNDRPKSIRQSARCPRLKHRLDFNPVADSQIKRWGSATLRKPRPTFIVLDMPTVSFLRAYRSLQSVFAEGRQMHAGSCHPPSPPGSQVGSEAHDM